MSEEPIVREMTPIERTIDRIWRNCWPLDVLFSRRFWTHRKKDYPQTWMFMPPRQSIEAKFLRWVCGLITGHEISKTEWGYGGGDYIDRHCRWCDKVIKVPVESGRFIPTFDEMRPDKWPEFKEAHSPK